MLRVVSKQLHFPHSGTQIKTYISRRELHRSSVAALSGSFGHQTLEGGVLGQLLSPAWSPERHERSSHAVTPKTFRLLSPEYVLPAAQCVAETFGQLNDPFTYSLLLKEHHWLSLCYPFIERASKAKKQISVIAVDEVKDKVIGVLINEDWTTPRPAQYRGNLGTDWHAVRAIFDELHYRFVRTNKATIVPGYLIRSMYFSCVHPSVRGEGVMKDLWRCTIDASRENGYGAITTQASTAKVRELLGDLGFQEITSVRYSEFEYEGSKPFMDIESAKVLQQSINGKKSEIVPLWGNRLSLHKRLIPSNLYV